jgi:glycosyltransferase involved in cell wall biosynthesis
MKILFPLAIFYPATVGGPSSTLYWHTCYLNDNQITPYVVTTDYKLDYKKHNILLNKWIQNEVGNVIYCKTRVNAFPLRALFETIIKIFQVDIIHYSSAYTYLTIYTIVVSILMRKMVLLSPRGEFFPNAIDSLKKRIVIIIYKTFQKRIIFHATSSEEYKHIKKIFPLSRIVIQPNFVLIPEQKKDKIKSKNIVFLGIIYGVKKIENLIEAVSMSKIFKESRSKILIAGKPLVERDFDYKLKLDNFIKELNLEDSVEFIGEIFGNDKEEFLNNAYLLVLPSESENFGNVVVEALSQSTPVIASKGTPWQLLQETNSGWWVDNNPSSLAKTIDTALSMSEEEYLIMCKNSLELVQSEFNIHTSKNNKWVEIYNNNTKQ